MARRSKQGYPEQIRRELVELLEEFEVKLHSTELRSKVLALVPANHILRDLGSSLVEGESTNSARDRILTYLRHHPKQLIAGDELMVVSGISEYARRIRELRVQFGWSILSGNTINQMVEFDDSIEGFCVEDLKPDTYFLSSNEPDLEAATRWFLANDIRKNDASVKDKILSYFQKNVGKLVTGEELKYLAKDRSEWARRVRELRTEEGWPIATKMSGRPDIGVGIYIMEEDRQAHVHDRKISDPVRVSVLERDSFSCCNCNWNHKKNIPSDPRNLLELHHIVAHADKGKNIKENLITLCNVCHDEVHRGGFTERDLASLIEK